MQDNPWFNNKYFAEQDDEEIRGEIERLKPQKFEVIKCPACRHGNLEIVWDDTGMYHKCNKCKKEISE